MVYVVHEAKEVIDNGMIEGSVNVPIRTLVKNIDSWDQSAQSVPQIR